MTHIVFLVVVLVLLIGLNVIIRIHLKTGRIETSEDFISIFLRRKEAEINRSASSISLKWYLRLMLILPVLFGAGVFLLTENGFLATIVAVAAIFIPKLILQIAKSTQGKNFERHYAESLEQMSASLRAGMSLYEAVEDVAECPFLNASMRKRYAKMSAKMKMGIPASEAFREFAEECRSKDASDIAVVIEIQSEIGGREADAVYEIASNIRKRIAMRREVKAALASTSSMVYIMDFAIPGGMLLFLVMNVNYLHTYFSSPLSVILFIVFVGLPFLGAFINHRMLNKVKRGEG